MDPQDPTDTHCIESAVVDKPPDRLRMNAKLIRHLAYADEPGISACRRHSLRSLAGPTITRMSRSNQCRGPEDPPTRRASLQTARPRATAGRQRYSAQRRRAKRAWVHPRSPRRRAARRATDSAPAAAQPRSGLRKLRNRSVELWTWSHLLSTAGLEADVLQRVGGLAVEPGSSPIVTAASGKVTLCDPR